jgi:hypothetical protein
MNEGLAHMIGLDRDDFSPIFLGDKTALIEADTPTAPFEVGQFIELRECSPTGVTGRVCEVEVTHVAPLFSRTKLLSITLVA